MEGDKKTQRIEKLGKFLGKLKNQEVQKRAR